MTTSSPLPPYPLPPYPLAPAPLPTGPLWRWDAADIARGIRSRAISSREAVAACLERLDAVNGRVNAVVERLDDTALAAADLADQAVAAGGPLGPLHGVPVTIKINIDLAGSATSNGLPGLAGNIAAEDAPVSRNWKAAGAIPFGRTNAPSMSLRWFTDNPLFGATLNPHDAGRSPGGSSGGAGAALATGIGPLAHGNDLGGSVRLPANWCGVAGIRPTLGRVPAFNPSLGVERMIVSNLAAVQGPLARSIRDLRMGLAAMAARDPRDPWWVPVPERPRAHAAPIRVALFIPDGTHPLIADTLRTAAGWLDEAGYVVDEASPPDFAATHQLWLDLLAAENRFGTRATAEKYGNATLLNMLDAMAMHATPLDMAGFIASLARRNTILRDWLIFFERYPLILMPVSLEPAMPLGADERPAAELRPLIDAFAPLNATAILGLPGLSVPTGFAPSPEGTGRLPLGVQIVGGRYEEATMLDAGAAIEARAGTMPVVEPA
ncbi:indoleacetamide hydrolase [Tistrella bauzanensis]|uniref:Indoleacetamide hydrolase n=1 Tax=Tistrella bauzanensis TaxID=657419 RepID=A0ABQ1IEE9_9PROT|nr:amidase [Tistrella bauzanensis]GGB36549.1 indoleacetamide hydrolase [Tistrella bauzanensis]